MATPGGRALWSGAISFGLAHVPVTLHAAMTSHDLDFDWLDRRSMDPVGYRRVNKRTGAEVPKADIVKAYQIERGAYVVLSDAEIRSAAPTVTQLIEIESFVDVDAIPFLYLDRPYYLSPTRRGAKAYSLLREALQPDRESRARPGGDPQQTAPGDRDGLRSGAGTETASLGR